MTDIVVRLELRDAEEEAAFGAYFTRFVEGVAEDMARLADRLDAPFLMVRSEPQRDAELRVVTFQEPSSARAFTAGWFRARPIRTAQA